MHYCISSEMEETNMIRKKQMRISLWVPLLTKTPFILGVSTANVRAEGQPIAKWPSSILDELLNPISLIMGVH